MSKNSSIPPEEMLENGLFPFLLNINLVNIVKGTAEKNKFL